MKMVVAFVRPSQADRIVHVLDRAGLFQLSLSRVHGVVRPNAPVVRADMAPEGELEIRLEAYCENDRVEHVVAVIHEMGRVGDLASGAMFVHPVDRAWGVGNALPR